MTVNEMILEVWQLLGEPTDIDPTDGTANPTTANIDTTTQGYTRILRALNQGQVRVATHRQPRGRMFRWKGGQQAFTAYITKDTTTAAATVSKDDTSVTVSVAMTIDEYRGYTMKIGNELHLVSSNSGTELSIAEGFEKDYPIGTEILLCPNWITIPDTEPVWVISYIRDMDTDLRLTPDPRTTAMLDPIPRGTAAVHYNRVTDLIYLDDVDMTDDRRLAYRIAYLRLPRAMSDTQESELPENYHWAMILWACGWGAWRQQDPNERKNMRDDFADFMRQTQLEAMREYDHVDLNGVVREDYDGYR